MLSCHKSTNNFLVWLWLQGICTIVGRKPWNTVLQKNQVKLNFVTRAIKTAVSRNSYLSSWILDGMKLLNFLLLGETPGQPYNPVQESLLQIEEEPLGDTSNGQMVEILKDLWNVKVRNLYELTINYCLNW